MRHARGWRGYSLIGGIYLEMWIVPLGDPWFWSVQKDGIRDPKGMQKHYRITQETKIKIKCRIPRINNSQLRIALDRTMDDWMKWSGHWTMLGHLWFLWCFEGIREHLKGNSIIISSSFESEVEFEEWVNWQDGGGSSASHPRNSNREPGSNNWMIDSVTGRTSSSKITPLLLATVG